MKGARSASLATLCIASLLLSSCHGEGPDNSTASGAPSDEPAEVVVLATGGTIASTHDAAGAVVPTVSGKELVDAVRDKIGANVAVEVKQVAELDSSAMTLRDTDLVLGSIAETLKNKDVTGIVVTHGTDSMEESVMAADLFHQDPRPVVFTGAMKAFDDEDPDGPGNLAGAINAAVDPANRDKGAFLSFGGDLLPARGVFKQDTGAVDGFATNAPAGAPRAAGRGLAALKDSQVWTVAAFPGAPRAVIDGAVAAGAKGIVVEAMGAGNVGTEVSDAIRDALKKGVHVAISTRVPQGPVVGVYGGAGGAATLFEQSAIGTGYLRAGQARIVLAAALATGTDPAEMFAAYQPPAGE